MTLWIDAQLPPTVARWIADNFGIAAIPVRDIPLRDAQDSEIFQAARIAKAVVMTKDVDFVELVQRLGTPPQVLWVKCGNTTNARLREILSKCLTDAVQLLENGEPIVEINEVMGH